MTSLTDWILHERNVNEHYRESTNFNFFTVSRLISNFFHCESTNFKFFYRESIYYREKRFGYRECLAAHGNDFGLTVMKISGWLAGALMMYKVYIDINNGFYCLF